MASERAWKRGIERREDARSLRYCCVWRLYFFFFSSRRRHTRLQGDWSSDVCSSDLYTGTPPIPTLRNVALLGGHVPAQAGPAALAGALGGLLFYLVRGGHDEFAVGDRKSVV